MIESGLGKTKTVISGTDGIPVLKLFWKMMLYKPGLYLINCILWTIIHVAPLLLGLLLKEFFNRLSLDTEFSLPLVGLIALAAAYAAGRMVNIFTGAWVDIYHRFTMSALLRRNMLEGILKKPGASSIPCSSGEALNCFRDDAETIENSISWTLDMIGNIIFVIVAVSIMININLKITLLVFTPLVLVVGIVQLLSSKLKKFRKDAREATGMVTGAMGEIFQAVQAVKVAGEEDHVIGYLEGLNKRRHKMMMKDTLLTQTLDAIFYNTVSLGTGFILLLAANLMKSGDMTVGDLSLFLYYLNFISDFTSFFGWFLANNRQAKVSFSRMTELMEEATPEAVVKHHKIPFFPKKENLNEPFTVTRENAPVPGRIVVKDLNYHYPGSGNGIEDISFSLEKGSFTVVTGRIGSGKSTLLKTLIGLLRSDSGRIIWNGREVEHPGEFFVPPYCAYTPQVPNLISDTVKNNILFGIAEEQGKLEDAIRSAVLEQDLKELEHGLDTVIGPKGVKLSGGQIQRVAAARMFARDAGLLVFDDISSALDVETENKLWARLFEQSGDDISSERTFLVVSNRRTALKHADQIIVMKDGRICAKGKPGELLDSCDELQEIWG